MHMNHRFTTAVAQVAIITGSGQGVGAAAAKLFAEHGAKVVVTDIDASKSDQVRSLLLNGVPACHVPCTCGKTIDCRWPQTSGMQEEKL